jgi:hypothetical protein
MISHNANKIAQSRANCTKTIHKFPYMKTLSRAC